MQVGISIIKYVTQICTCKFAHGVLLTLRRQTRTHGAVGDQQKALLFASEALARVVSARLKTPSAKAII